MTFKTTNAIVGRLGIGVCLIPVFANAGCSASGEKALSTKPAAAPVRICEVTGAKQREHRELSGSLVAARETLVSSEVSANIVSWPLNLGDKVEKGDVIAVLDQRTVLTQLQAARAKQAEAQAGVAKLKSEYTIADNETAAQIDAAKANVMSATANETKVNDSVRGQELRQFEARLSQCKADENLAKKELDRYRKLFDGGAASRQTMDQVQAKFDVALQARILAEQSVSLAKEGARVEDRKDATSKVRLAQAQLLSAQARPARLATISSGIRAAEAQLAAVEAQIAQLNVLLSKHVIRAPYKGRVLKTSAELGQIATPGTPLILLGETTKLKLQFSIPESDRVRLTKNTVVFTAQSAPGKSFLGTITSKGYIADSRTRNFSFEATVDNQKEYLLPGMVALVRVPMSQDQSGTEVPLEAITMDGTKAEVFVLQNSRVERRRVLIGDKRGANIVVSEGLKIGEKVVRAPKGLADGQEVEVLR